MKHKSPLPPKISDESVRKLKPDKFSSWKLGGIKGVFHFAFEMSMQDCSFCDVVAVVFVAVVIAKAADSLSWTVKEEDCGQIMVV